MGHIGGAGAGGEGAVSAGAVSAGAGGATARAPTHLPGRICGIKCLPANLNLSDRIPDVRGYDAVDPAPLVILLDGGGNAAAVRSEAVAYHGVDARHRPRRARPVADLLNVAIS